MGTDTEKEDLNLRNRMRSYRQRSAVRFTKRDTVVKKRDNSSITPEVLKQGIPPIKPFVARHEPISADRFYLPKQRRSGVLRRSGVRRGIEKISETTYRLRNQRKVIVIFIAATFVSITVIFLLAFWQAHRILRIN